MAIDLSRGLLGNTVQATSPYTQTGQQVGNLVGSLFGLKVPEFERNRIFSQLDYNEPASLQAAAQELARMGMVDQAVALAGQARQITRQEQQFGLEKEKFGLEQEKFGITKRQAEEQDKRAERTLTLQEETAFLDKLTKSPRAAMADIVAMDDGPKKNMLLTQASQSMDKARLDEEYKQAQIEALRAQARTAGAKGFEVIKDSLGKPIGRFNKSTGEIEDMPGVKDTGGAGGTKSKTDVAGAKSLLLGGTNTETATETAPTAGRSSAGQMGRGRSGVPTRIPNPPPMMTRGGRRNPEYDEWEKEFGAAYRARMAGQ